MLKITALLHVPKGKKGGKASSTGVCLERSREQTRLVCFAPEQQGPYLCLLYVDV